jgi:sulfur carrier protein
MGTAATQTRLPATSGGKFCGGYVEHVEVVANGKPVELADGATVVDLLERLGLGARWVVVEHNGKPVERVRMAATTLADGDRLELVRAVAGG